MDTQKEREIEKAHHNKILHDYEVLKNHYDNLRHEMTVLKQTHRRTPSDNSTVSFESAEGEPVAAEPEGEEDEERQAAHVVAQVVAEPDDKEVSVCILYEVWLT